jgi:hypothetical protein
MKLTIAFIIAILLNIGLIWYVTTIKTETIQVSPTHTVKIIHDTWSPGESIVLVSGGKTNTIKWQ